MEQQFKIGDECYVVDNSYSWNITKNVSAHSIRALAGTGMLDPVKVKVVSEPYCEQIINIVDRTETYEFINVEYDGDIYRVLNHLTNEFIPSDKEDYTLFDL